MKEILSDCVMSKFYKASSGEQKSGRLSDYKDLLVADLHKNLIRNDFSLLVNARNDNSECG